MDRVQGHIRVVENRLGLQAGVFYGNSRLNFHMKGTAWLHLPGAGIPTYEEK
jgi:hypothetical protein